MDTDTKISISEELLAEIQSKTLEEKQVILHCYFEPEMEGSLIRIWKSSYLIDKASGHKSELVHQENISLYPFWTVVPAGKEYCFTLIFTGLPSSCTYFDFAEIIPQDGGFFVGNIARNKTDIYRVKI